MSAQLPIYQIKEAFLNAVSESRQIILQAPTGSGKSTQIPQFLLENNILGNGQAVILQPRRLAARLLSKRVAEERFSPLGREIGYQIRFENKTSRETKIRFVTEGILLRQLLSDPQLKGINAIVFDEFHERHLETDLALALAKKLQASSRPDLLIVVMSATLQTSLLEQYLPGAKLLTTEGRTFPVTHSYVPLGAGNQRPIWEVANDAVKKWVQTNTKGDILIFMPGGFEIRKTIDALNSNFALKDWLILPLYGDLPPDQQDAAVATYRKRKIVVATNVAETSITIDGILCVIDSGIARVASYDTHRGINTLLLEKISRASADQRAGRAGRTAPGDCLRLWSNKDHESRSEQELPEIKRIDLSETILLLKSCGIDNLTTFDWIEPPTEIALKKATTLLTDLGALHPENEVITPTGKRMVDFPAHPRYARMLLAAEDYNCVPDVCLAVAISQGRSLLLPNKDKRVEREREEYLGDESTSDLILDIKAFHYAQGYKFQANPCRALGIHAVSARQADRVYQQFIRLAEKQGLDTSSHASDDTGLRKSILAGFSDQLAKRMDRGTLRCDLVHGRRGELQRSSTVRRFDLIVPMEINEIQSRDVSVLLSQATGIEPEWLSELFPEDIHEEERVVFDTSTRRVEAERVTRFRDLILSSKLLPEAPEEPAAKILADKICNGSLKLKNWTDKLDSWISRLNFLAKAMPELALPTISPDDLPFIYEQLCLGGFSFKDVKNRDPWPILHDWLSVEQKAALDYYAPESYQLTDRRKCKVRYSENDNPVIGARIQELYDIKTNPSIADGRIPLRIEILAPNQRPVQITDDLQSFWTGAYPSIKKELAGRYPKHEWR